MQTTQESEFVRSVAGLLVSRYAHDRSAMADQEARIRRIQRRLPSSPPHAGPAGTIERSRSAPSAAATPPQASGASSSPQGLSARAAAQAAVAIKRRRAVGILETRGPKPNTVACPRAVALCAAFPTCQHVSIAAVAAVPLVPSRGRPGPRANGAAFLARGSSLAPNLCAVGCSPPLGECRVVMYVYNSVGAHSLRIAHSLSSA